MSNQETWKVFRLNDCDWWLARSLVEAVEDAMKVYGADEADMVEDARELSDEELDKTTFRLEAWECECGAPLNKVGADFRWNGSAWEHHHGYPIGHVAMRKEISFREELTRRIKAGARTEPFASTEC